MTLLRVGSQQLDGLHWAQVAAQEVLEVIAAAMLQQQGVMWALSAWELEAGDLMREMLRAVEEGESDL